MTRPLCILIKGTHTERKGNAPMRLNFQQDRLLKQELNSFPAQLRSRMTSSKSEVISFNLLLSTMFAFILCARVNWCSSRRTWWQCKKFPFLKWTQVLLISSSKLLHKRLTISSRNVKGTCPQVRSPNNDAAGASIYNKDKRQKQDFNSFLIY